MKDIIKPVAVLAGICLVVTALLAYVNMITLPIITKAEEEASAQARAEVLSEADGFEKLDLTLPEGVLEAFGATNGAGYVFELSSKGYGGNIVLICGIKADGTIEQVKTLTHSETSGIGSKVVDNASPYRKQYEGKTEDNYDSVDAVTGATISSKAYKKAIDAAFEAYKEVKEAK
ncbi:MAG TPA: hypothetical protein DEO32_01565 [Ruminococcaceae bacterium]|nr:hypothetical protein [Oscillospiraceae bacterium]